MRLIFRIVLGLTLCVVLFDLIVAVMARREYATPPRPDEDWIVHDQVVLPDNGRPVTKTVVMVHGFGGSPLDFKPLARPLANRGFRVVMPVTPGQGRDVVAHHRGDITAEDNLSWLRGVIRTETILAGGEKPDLVGFSMGGALATVIASEDLVDRVVLLGPFYALPTAGGLLQTLAGVLEWVVPVVPKPWRGNIADESVYEEYFPGTWFISIGAFLRLQDLADQARVAATVITRPTLLLGSSNDYAASFAVSKELYTGNEFVTVHEFPKSDHILLYDYDREEVIRMVIEFLSAE